MISDKFKLIVKYFPQVFASLTASLGAISDGMQYGWQSPSVPKLQTADSPIPTTATDLIWLDSMYFIGSLTALPIIAFSTDKIGRKRTIQVVAVIFCLAWLLVAFSDNIIELFIARFLAGFGSDACYSTAPLYVAEISNQKIRGFLGSFVYMNFMIGMVLIYSIGPYTTIQNTAFVGLAIPLTQLITFSLMPESPYYSLIKIREKQAEKSLKYLRKSSDVQGEFNDIKAAVIRQESEKSGIKDLFSVPSNRKGLIIIMVLYFAQNFVASTILFMNLHSILESAHSLLDANTSAIIFAVVMLFSCLFGSAIMDKVGKIRLMNYSSAVTGLALGLLCIYFWLQAYGVDLHDVRWIPALAVILYGAGFMAGLGGVPVIISAELFPTTVKCNAVTLSVGGYTIFGLISLYFHRFVSEAFGLHVVFTIYTLCCFATILYNIHFVPETTGKTLEEIQMILKGITLTSIAKNDKIGKDNDGFILNP